jgi:uncharacterized protein (DUF488 family)
MTQQILTIGHSNYSFEIFLNLLQTYNIAAIADVRRFPGSKKFPDFNKETLEELLENNHTRYFHFPELGGRRKPQIDSGNKGLRNESFRGFADYMETDDFRKGIDKLLEVSSEYKTAIMCSEAVWWRCHRSLISDYLKSKGHKVLHIINKKMLTEHPYTSAAKIKNGILNYPEESLGFD